MSLSFASVPAFSHLLQAVNPTTPAPIVPADSPLNRSPQMLLFESRFTQVAARNVVNRRAAVLFRSLQVRRPRR